MPHRIEVCLKLSLADPAGRRLKARILSDLGISVGDLRVADAYIIDRNLSHEQLEVLMDEVFRDPVVQEAAIDGPVEVPFDKAIEVGFRPGVTDNVGRTSREAVERTLGIKFGPGEGVYARKLFLIQGKISSEQTAHIARDL